MDAGIFVVRDEQSLIRMNARPYENELDLQLLVAKYPDLLAGDQINPSVPRRWLLVQQEAGVPAELGGGDWWALDHLFLDQDSVPTFVEVKRAADTRSRREVVAQMLDYAANATRYWPVDRMRDRSWRTSSAPMRSSKSSGTARKATSKLAASGSSSSPTASRSRSGASSSS